MFKSIIALLVAITASISLASPANAQDLREYMRYPLEPQINTLVIEGPNRAWGLRYVAEHVDDRVPRFNIISKQGVQCSSYTGVMCVKVVIDYYGATGWHGTAALGAWTRTITFNESYGKSQHVACHEFMHVMGLDHNPYQGCVADYSSDEMPHVDEINAINNYYGGTSNARKRLDRPRLRTR